MKRRTTIRNLRESDNGLSIDVAVEETKRYAKRILANPEACPMFPVINKGNGLAETLCYVQGYLAGLVSSMGEKPSKELMDALAYETLCDPSVRDMAVKMQAPIDLDTCLNPPREY